MVNILAFVNEPPWHIKAVISARSFLPRLQSHATRYRHCVADCFRTFLRLRCFRSSAFGRLPTWQGIFPQTNFISLPTLYLALFASVFMFSSDLACYSFPTKAPNHAMQLTGSARHGSCSPQTPTQLPRRAPPLADLVLVRRQRRLVGSSFT